MEQIFNLKFVNEVEKRPVLYNYTIKGYSKKNITEKAWSEVGKEVDLTVTECKEKWKNLRSVFVRHTKPSSGSGTKTKKPYYLMDAMKFTLPFIKTLGSAAAANLSFNACQTAVAGVEQDSNSQTDNLQDDPTNEEEISESSDGSPSPCPLPTPSTSNQLLTNFSQKEQTDFHQEVPNDTSTSCRCDQKSKKRSLTDIDEFFGQYLRVKTRKLNNSDTANEGVRQNEDKKMFLLSLLPEIEAMTETQMKIFRRRVFQLIDDITNTKPVANVSTSDE